MKTQHRKRLVAFLLVFALLASFAPAVSAAETEGFRCSKTAKQNPDGTVSISLRAFQTGEVPAADVVMVLDVSGSMENSTPVPVNEIDATKDYYIKYARFVEIDGEMKNKQFNVRVHNTAAAGETPAWFGQLTETGPERQVTPGDGTNGTYQFYTGAMDALRAAAKDFVHSVARNAVQYEADHRIAVVEFSSPVPKGNDALCTHSTQPDPYYANILTGSGTSSGALLSAKDSEQSLSDIFDSMTAAGPTYSDDAMTQAKRILSASTASRRAVILFTDGGPGSFGWNYDIDDTSLLTANGAIAAAAVMKRSGVQIYTIGVFNEENLAGTAGEKNRRYLSVLSSNYPNAESMNNTGTQQADGYCSIGDLHMDLSGAFAGISAALGEPIESAQVRDTVSKYFYLTDAQRQALLQAYPDAQIVDNEDGSTTVSLESIDFPPVAVLPNGEVENENAAGIFNLTFDVTPRAEFLGGDGVATNSGLCGVFAEGVQIAQFTAPTVDVPVNESALDGLLKVCPQTVFTDETLSAEMLYTDLSQDSAADFATVTYSVADPDGAAFSEQTMTTAGTYTFTVHARAQIGERVITRQKTVDVTVIEDTLEKLQIESLPTKTQYFYGQNIVTDGLKAVAVKRSGKTVDLNAEQLSVSPETLTEVGMQTVTVTYEGLSSTFDVTVELYDPSLTLAAAPAKQEYIIGERLNTTGLTLLYLDEYGVQHTVTEGFTCTPETLTEVGTQTVTVTYEGLSATFDVTVKPISPVSIRIIGMPNICTYPCNSKPDTTGLVVEVTYNDGTKKTITEGFTCSPETLTQIGTQIVTVSYEGFSATFSVTVEPLETTLTLQSEPTKKDYFVGQALDTAGLQLLYTDEVGDAMTVTEGFTCTPQKLTASGTQTVTVTYKDKSVTFTVTVKPVSAVSLTVVSGPSDRSYTYKSSPNFSGLVVRVKYNDGHEETVSDRGRMRIDAANGSRVRNGSKSYRVTVDGVSDTFSMQVRLAPWQWLILIFLFGFIWY